MKKILQLACIMMLLASCNKEGGNLDNRLVGTKWQSEDYLYEMIFGGDCFNVLEFVSENEVEQYVTRNGNIDHFIATHKYTLNYPSLIIRYVSDDGVTKDCEFTFENSRELIKDGIGTFNDRYVRQ